MNTLFDARHLRCPMPVVEARKRLKKLAPDESLTVLCKEVSTVRDFESFCQMNPYVLTGIIECPDYYEITLKPL